MRTLTVYSLAVLILAGMMTAGGCVSKAKYDELMAMNRKANDERNAALAAAQQLRMENQRLTEELANAQNALAGKDKEIALLQAAKADLQKAYDDLMAKYNALAGRPPQVMPEIALPPELDKALRDLAAANGDLLEYDAKHGMVKLKSDLTFEKGSDFVRSEAKAALAKFVQIVNSQTGMKYNIYVAGHTDDIPILKPETKRTHPDNWYLSVHRAVAVEKELSTAGLAPQRIGAMGFGEYHPVAPNAPGKKGNALNRRVELWIVPPDRFLTLTSTSASAAE
jgi:chemotaxis protein MotB